MEKSAYPNPQSCGFEPAKLRDFLAARFPRDTAKSVAVALNVSPRTAENWLELRAAPGVWHFARMIGLWGPEFLAAALARPPAWLDAAARADQRAALERDIARLQFKQRALEARQ